MEPCIRRWHTQVRFVAAGGSSAARIDGVRAQAAEAYAAALEQVFGNDPAVYVIRRVHTELTLVNPTLADEAAAARRWGAQACAAVVRTVARHADDGALVMRFDDTADFVAHFLADLIDGVAWERWYYAPFVRYRQLAVDEVLRRLLVEYSDWLPPLFQRLERSGHARAVVARLGPVDAREVWRAAILRAPEEPSIEELRLFVRAAMQVVDALALWVGGRPEETVLLEQYGRASPLRPDWKEPRALAQAVLEVLAFLRARSVLRVPARVDAALVAEVVAPLQWLDREWLCAAIESLVVSPAPVTEAMRPASLTGLQRRILEVLLAIARRGALVLPGGTERNAIALFAALAAAEPSLAAEPSAPAAIAWVLDRCKPADASPPVLVRAIESALGVPLTTSPSALLIDTQLGGLFLLSRALIDARLPQLAAALGVTFPDLLLALVTEWTGETELDEGTLFWSGGQAILPVRTDRIVCLPQLAEAVERLMRDRAAFAPSLTPNLDPATPPLRAIALHLLRLWALWLPGFPNATADWLVAQFIRRRGVLRVDDDTVAVSLAPLGLDVVLDMAGYLAPIAEVPWLGDRRVTFTIDRSLA